jgi:glycosyltransferase involved in cell wall biosynthesis
VASIPEIAGDAAEFVDPNNGQSIANAMLKFAKDENLKNMYREKGKIQVAKFDWDKCARETLAVYKSFDKKE